MTTRAYFSHLIREVPVSATFMCLPWDRYGQKLVTNLQKRSSLLKTNDTYCKISYVVSEQSDTLSSQSPWLVLVSETVLSSLHNSELRGNV